MRSTYKEGNTLNIKKAMPDINKHIDKTKPYISPSENAHKNQFYLVEGCSKKM